MKSEWFDPHKSFLSLKIVWGTVLILATMSISSAVMIVFNSETETRFIVLRIQSFYLGF